jgi:hypothetical protein
MPKMGLVLEGGGALGAYDYGAVTRLVELGWQPVAVTGVSSPTRGGRDFDRPDAYRFQHTRRRHYAVRLGAPTFATIRCLKTLPRLLSDC